MNKLNIQALSRELDDFKKSLMVVGFLTELLKPKGIKPILVGGRALEFYTLGGYATKDIDLVIEGREQAKDVLASLGFQRSPGERHWYHESLDLAIEIPGEVLAGSLEKLTVVEIEGIEVFIIGIEDLIVDRLAAAKFWQSQRDEQWAVKLLTLHAEEIEQDYLEKAAQKEGVDDILQKSLKKSRAYLHQLKKSLKS